MLVELHMIQNHAPSNLNRDDTGSPKDCVFGAVRRARISSQCLKRSIRRSKLFKNVLADIGLGTRTRRLPERVKERLLERGIPEEVADAAAAKSAAFGRREGGGSSGGSSDANKLQTAQMMFLAPTDIDAVADAFYEIAATSNVDEVAEISTNDLQKKAELRGWRAITPDIALCGRMITSDSFRDVDASVQVAHAISTHKMDHEFDYYTAVDDLLEEEGEDEDDSGAGMIGDIEFNSACYYKYFSIDVDALVDNLAGAKERADVDDEDLEAARRIAATSVEAFIRASIFVTPSGKQNSFAAHQLPDGVLIEVRPERTPISYANAFVKPARARGNNDLVDESLKMLRDHVVTLTTKFGLRSSPRYWFSTRDLEFEGMEMCDTVDELIGGVAEAVAKHA